MKLNRSRTLSELAEILGCEYIGDGSINASGINEIHMVQAGDIVFVDHHKYYQSTLSSAASIIIIDKDVECPPNKGLLVHKSPFTAFNTLIEKFSPNLFDPARVSQSAQIDASSKIHSTASIGANTVIGANTLIGANVSIGENCLIGNNVVIQANSTFGSDAFYYKTHADRFERLLSCGRVILEDHVEIGAGCTIDRGSTGDTVIGTETKLDNQVHIAHDVVIGKRCLIAAQVGIAGCVTIEDNVTIWGQVGCIANITIGKGATILAQSGISKSLEGGKTYFGSPAGEARKKMKELTELSRLASSSD
ncbi:MAG: UDP-3-O-(3-hydroxymyristoyl)glucosamine N-acyltransferase [Salibacteraceae bacterium]